MKKLPFFLSLFCLLFFLPAKAQNIFIQAESYLRQIPDIPFSPCAIRPEDSATVNKFEAQIQDIETKLRKLKDSLTVAQKKDMKATEEAIKKQKAQEYGLSSADVEKMKSGKMSKEEKMAMAEKMMQGQKINFSVEQASKIKTKEGKKAWAESLSEEQKAEYVGKSEAANAKDQAGLQKIKDRNSIVEEKTLLTEELNAKEQKILQLYLDIENDSSRHRMERELKAAKLEYEQSGGEDFYGQVPRIDKLADKYNLLCNLYCTTFTPPFLHALELHKAHWTDNKSKYYRLEELNNIIHEQMIGNNAPAMTKGTLLLDGINGFLLKYHPFEYVPQKITFIRKEE
ncbi:MAG: hypothetical protein U0T77_06325 [Chitinophagales bacterium]